MKGSIKIRKRKQAKNSSISWTIRSITSQYEKLGVGWLKEKRESNNKCSERMRFKQKDKNWEN